MRCTVTMKFRPVKMDEKPAKTMPIRVIDTSVCDWVL